MSEVFPPAVARFTSDATEFISGIAKANGATRDWQAELGKADLASRKTGASAEAASQRAAVAMKRAADAAKGLAAAQSAAADAATKLAAGQATQEEAAAAAAKATDAETLALQAQARAALATERASIAASDAQLRLAGQAKLAADSQAAGAARSEAAWASVGAGLTKVSKAGAVAFAVIGIASIKMAGDFQQQTNVLVTAAGELPKNLAMVRTGILDIATQTGTAWQKVTEGVYVAEKAGYRGAAALQVVKAAAQGAKEEGADLGVVLNATTSVMASYGLKSGDAVRVTNALKTGAGEAKVTMQEYAGSLSTVLPIASAAKINFADIAGALATLTQHGTTANEGTFELAGTIKALQAPTAVARKEMAQFGIDSVNVATNIGSDKRGLVGTIQYLTQTILTQMGPAGTVLLNTFNQSQQAAQAAQTELNALPPAAKALAQSFEDGKTSVADYRKESRALPGEQAVLAQQFFNTYSNAKGFQDVIKGGGPAAQTYVQALKAMLGGQLGLNTALQLTSGTNLPATEDRTKKVAAAYASAGKNVSGWEITQKNFNTRLSEFKQQAEAAGIRLGEKLIPPLEKVLNVLTAHPAVIEGVIVALGLLTAAWAAMKIASLIDGMGTLASRILGVGTAAATAAPEVAALGAAGSAGGVGAGAVGAAGAARYALPAAGVASRVAASPLARVATPVTVAIGGFLITKEALASLQALGQHQFGKALTDGLNNALLVGLTGGVSKGIAAAFKTGDIAKVVTGTPGYKALTDVLGHFGVGGKLTGTFDTKNLVKVNGQVDEAASALKRGQKASDGFWASLNQSADIKAFQDGLKNAQSVLDSASNSLVDHAHESDLDRHSIEANREGIEALVTKAVQAAKSYATLTGDSSNYTKSLNLAIPAIEDAAVKTGLNRGQVDQLIRSLGILPPNKAVPVTTPGADTANAAILTMLGSLNSLPQTKTVTLNLVSAFSSGQITASNNLGNLFGFTGGNGGGPAAATGGYLQGPGSGTSDSILARVSNGEYVVRADMVKQYGIGFFDAVNAGRYAGGGVIVNTTATGFDTATAGVFGAYNSAASSAAQAATAQLVKQISAPVGASVSRWAPLVLQVLSMLGQPASFLPNVLRQIATESGGNPGITQGISDSNSAQGILAQGLLQVIPGTFAANAGPFLGLGPFNPLASLYAGLHHAINDDPGGLNYLGQGHGYAKGGLVGRYAGGGLVGANGFLHDMATLGAFTKAQNTTLAFNRANINKAGRANVPGLERAAQTAAEVARATSSYFYAHKPQLVRAMHTGSKASRNAATAVFNQLSTFTGETGYDAQQEAALASQLRSRFAGQESAPLRFGAPTRDLSYLALGGLANVGGGTSAVHVTVVSALDGKEIARNTAKVFLRNEQNNLSNGTTRIRNRTVA